MLTMEEKIAIINYRRQKSYDSLNEAKEIAKLGFWNLVGNRLYYAAFHMASALLLDKGIIAKTHAGIIHLIGSQFVARGILKNVLKSLRRFYLTGNWLVYALSTRQIYPRLIMKKIVLSR